MISLDTKTLFSENTMTSFFQIIILKWYLVVFRNVSKYACHFPNELQVSSFQMIEDSFSSGYNWCVDTIKMSSQHSQLANDLEINKAVMFLKQKDFTSAVETLKAFEKQVLKNT